MVSNTIIVIINVNVNEIIWYTNYKCNNKKEMNFRTLFNYKINSVRLKLYFVVINPVEFTKFVPLTTISSPPLKKKMST